LFGRTGYPGTKHSSVIHMRNTLKRSRSECKEAAGVSSNKAFERYYELQDDTLRELYQSAKGRIVRLEDVKNRLPKNQTLSSSLGWENNVVARDENRGLAMGFLNNVLITFLVLPIYRYLSVIVFCIRRISRIVL